MNPAYHEWAAYHSRVFGLGTDADAEMLLAWCVQFEREGWSAGELRLVTDSMITGTAPKFRSDHLRAIQEGIRDLRAAIARHHQEALPDRGTCVLCGNTGMAIVPHPRVASGELRTWYTCAVRCRCSYGYHLDNASMLTLAEYERLHPGWRSLMAQHDATEQARHRAEVVTKDVDNRLGQIARRIGMMPGPNE